jgi:fructan beta-fructosidase
MIRLGISGIVLCLLGCVNNNETSNVDQGGLYRPQFHFTPANGWMNDPNGMFFYEGEYHLFYQYYPDSTVWGPMHWGHAVSKDIMHWEQLPIALYPDSMGYIFSGSAVVDTSNTSGLGTKENPPIVAVFTYHNMEGEKSGRIDYQTQGIAYSLDKGRSWTKYNKNPVLLNPGIKDFRDPKVSWNEVAKQWVMTLAVKDHIEFYSSPDLKQWTKLSEFGQTLGAHGGVWECPDLFSLSDNEGKMHWVLLVSINPGGPQGGSATQYFVGDFDGKNFTSQDTITRWIDRGADNYAGVTWSDIPTSDGRRLFMGWMSNWQYAQVVPTKTWRSAMTLPRELSLRQTPNGLIVISKPVRKIVELFSEVGSECFNEPTTFQGPVMINFDVPEEQVISFSLANAKGEKVRILLQNEVFSVDRIQSGVTAFHETFPAVHSVPLDNIKVNSVEIYVDASSLEIFINDGEIVMTELIFPSERYTMVNFENPGMGFCVTPILPAIVAKP